MSKSVDDLPCFTIDSLRTEAGEMLLTGHFNRAVSVHTRGSGYLGWHYLYSFGAPYLAATVVSFDSASGRAVYRVSKNHALKKRLQAGADLRWLSAAIRPEAVDAVLDTTHEWKALVFGYHDAFSRKTKQNLSRQAAKSRRSGMKSGHEHCGICMASIVIGDKYYPYSNYLFCANCYEKYLRTHDLSFLFPS